MRAFSWLLLVLVAASVTGCADLTRPDEILIIAEAPPAPKPAPIAAPTPAEPAAERGPQPGAKKAGG